MAGFHEISFPDDIAYGSAGGLGYRTQVTVLDSGDEQRVSRISDGRHQYNIAYAIRSHTQLNAVRNFFVGRLGALNGFRFKDNHDFSTDSTWRDAPSPTDVHIATGDASTTVFQLFKAYTSGAVIRNRTIVKPIGSSVRVALDGVEQLTGWSVNSTTGLLTFTVAPGSGVIITVGFQFEVPVRFTEDSDRLLSATLADFSSGDIDQLTLVEIITATPVDEEFYYGGSAPYSISSNVSITQLQGRVHVITPTVGSLIVSLPDMATGPGGGPHFYIVNASGSHSLIVKNAAGTTVNTIAAGTGKTYVYEKISGVWYAL